MDIYYYNLKFSQTNPIRIRSSDLDPIDPERQLTVRTNKVPPVFELHWPGLAASSTVKT